MSAVDTLAVREARPDEHAAAGRLLVAVYAALPGFPSPQEQPGYYATLANVGTLAGRPGAQLLVAAGADGALAGVVVYFGDMAQYGSGGIATMLRDAAGIRLLAVDPARRGGGVGSLLTEACIARARAARCAQVVLHTTRAMPVAWRLYEQMGFVRDVALDFDQQGLPVHGFRLPLGPARAT